MEVIVVDFFDMHAALNCPLLGLAYISSNDTLFPVSTTDARASNREASRHNLRSLAQPPLSLTLSQQAVWVIRNMVGNSWVLLQRVLQTIHDVLQTIQPMLLNMLRYRVDQNLVVVTTAEHTLSDYSDKGCSASANGARAGRPSGRLAVEGCRLWCWVPRASPFFPTATLGPCCGTSVGWSTITESTDLWGPGCSTSVGWSTITESTDHWGPGCGTSVGRSNITEGTDLWGPGCGTSVGISNITEGTDLWGPGCGTSVGRSNITEGTDLWGPGCGTSVGRSNMTEGTDLWGPGCGTLVGKSNITEGTDHWRPVDFEQDSLGARSPGARMQIFVTTLSGTTVALDVKSADPVATMMLGVQAKVRVPPCMHRLLYAGKKLEARRTLADYNIQRESTLVLVLQLRGGVLNDWSTLGQDPAVDAAAAAIRAGPGSEEFKNKRIETLARQYDLGEAGLDNPALGRSTLELARALERQFELESERREEERQRTADERRRLEREADLDTAHKKAYIEVFEHLYGNTRYPMGHPRRGGIINTYSADEAKTQIIWWAEKGGLVIEDVLLYSHLVWADNPQVYAAILLRYRDKPSRSRADNVIVTEMMEEDHKDRHPQFKSRNLPKILACPFPLLPPVCEEFVWLNQDILDHVPDGAEGRISGGGGMRLPMAYKRVVSLGVSFRVSIRPPVQGGEPYFFVEGPDPRGRYAVDMGPASDAVANLQAQGSSNVQKSIGLCKAVQPASKPAAVPQPKPGGQPGPTDRSGKARRDQQPGQTPEFPARRRQPRGAPAGGSADDTTALVPRGVTDDGASGDPSAQMGF